jgi:hypothetical protein
MKSLLIASAIWNKTNSCGTYQKVRSSIGKVATNQSHVFINKRRSKWHAQSMILLLMMLLLFSSSVVQAADRYTVANGNWNSTSVWSNSDQGTSGYSVPVAGDNVYITRGFDITITANAACANIYPSTNGQNGISTLTFSGSYTLTVSGSIQLGGASNAARTNSLTLASGSTVTANSMTLGGSSAPGTLTMTAGGTLIVGSITIGPAAGTWTPGSGTVILTSSSTLPSTIFTSFNNLTITNSSTVTLPAIRTISNNLSIETGAKINLGTFTHTAGTLTLGGAGTVNGSWGSNSSSATNKNNTYFAETTGIVNVTTSTCTPPSAPTVTTPLYYCQSVAADPLSAEGSDLLWYAQLTGGLGSSTPPTPSTAAVGTISYYVSQTVNCEGPRAKIDVIIRELPVATVPAQSIVDVSCFSGSDGSLTINASGGTDPYSFSVEGGAIGTWESGSTPFTKTGLTANHPYRIKVKDANGCVSK